MEIIYLDNQWEISGMFNFEVNCLGLRFFMSRAFCVNCNFIAELMTM